MYSIIIDVSNFNIIPESMMDKMYEVLGLNNEEDESFNSEFDTLDIF